MGVILDSCIWVGLASGQVQKEAVAAAEARRLCKAGRGRQGGGAQWDYYRKDQ